jgi:general stress protein 26
VDGDENWSWCVNNERVHLKVVPTKNGQPHMGAMTRAGDRDNMYLLSLDDIEAVKVYAVFCFHITPKQPED